MSPLLRTLLPPSMTSPTSTLCKVRILSHCFRSVFILLLLLFFTRLDIQNYGCNGNLLCYHGVVERNRISSAQSHGKALEKECCLPGVFCDIIIITQHLTRHVSVIRMTNRRCDLVQFTSVLIRVFDLLFSSANR